MQQENKTNLNNKSNIAIAWLCSKEGGDVTFKRITNGTDVRQEKQNN